MKRVLTLNSFKKLAQRALLMLALVSLGSLPRITGQDSEFTVRSAMFHAVTTRGQNAACRVVELRDESGKDISNWCTGQACSGFRMGFYNYVLQLKANGRLVDGRAMLYSKEQWITVGIGPTVGDAGDMGPLPLKGHVAGIDRNSREPAWIRLQMVYAEAAEERAIPESGDFAFDNVPEGKWLVLVLQGQTVLFNQVYTFPMANNLEIDLRTGSR